MTGRLAVQLIFKLVDYPGEDGADTTALGAWYLFPALDYQKGNYPGGATTAIPCNAILDYAI